MAQPESTALIHPSVVVADMALSKGESFGWLRRLLTRCPGMRVVVLTSHDEKIIEEQALSAGAMRVVRKRDIATRLLPTIEALLTESPPPAVGP